MTYAKTPDNLAALTKEAEEISRAIAAVTDSDTDVARVLELVRETSAHAAVLR
ncbi:hypothetical protein ABZ892_33175 [Streptomyces sp. NPDC046924]|uniref:hypothetical protein n=1 Tax=Streptomyces sp. NPDC046924 TaxID=3155136 RepID=UPI0034119D89